MISFLQNVLQRHYKWLFSILLVVIIISFVFTIGAAPGIGRSKVKEREFYGFNLNSEETVHELSQAASLTFLLNTGEEPYSSKELEQALLTRALFLHVADQLQIPTPTEEQLVAFIQKVPFFQDKYGRFDNQQYQAFFRTTQFSKTMSQGFVRECLMQNYRLEQVQVALRGPAYILPSEIENYVEKLETSWNLQTATLDYTKFNPNISISEEELEEYFELNKVLYTIPPQYKVSYLLFEKNRFIDKVEEPTDKTLKSFYNRRLSDFEQKFNITDPDKAFDQHKAQILQAYKESKAQRDAATAANQFLYSLYDQDIERDSYFYQQLLKEYGIVEKSVRTFNVQKYPEYPEFSNDIWKQVFTLTPKQYYSNVLSHDKNALVLLLDEITPSQHPSLDDVRQKVVSDLKNIKKQEYFLREGARLEDQLIEGLQKNTSFSRVAKKLNLDVDTLDHISLSNRPEKHNLILKIQAMKAGELSKMIIQNQGETQEGVFVYVESKHTPTVSANSEAWIEAKRQLGFINQIARAQGSIAELVAMGLKESE